MAGKTESATLANKILLHHFIVTAPFIFSILLILGLYTEHTILLYPTVILTDTVYVGYDDYDDDDDDDGL